MAAFEDGHLPGASFHHADHVRMAFLYLSRYPATEALERFSAALRRLADANGQPHRYHETITWAYLFLVRERMARAERVQSWAEFAADNPDLLDWKDNVLKRYYRGQTLSSELAKRTFLMPDR
jgi:hypothetical protein